MAKLPTCPHCKTIYRYGDVSKAMSKNQCKCYHCKKDFRVSKKKFLILFLIIALICAIFDVLELYMIGQINLIAIVITNIIVISIGFLLRPFAVSFLKTDKVIAKGQENSANNKKKIDTKNYNKK